MDKKKNKVLLAMPYDPAVSEIRDLLIGDGYQVIEASTAEEALEIQERERAHIVCVDLELSEMGGDGLSLALSQEDDESRRKVYIIISCSGRKSDIERCGKCLANTYIRKPLDARETVSRIRNVLSAELLRATRVLVKIDVRSLYHNESFFCTSNDLSITGILLEADKTLAKGDTINISFFLPDEEKITSDGKVVRVVRGDESKYIYGVEFTRLEDETKEIISRFVNKQREEGNFF